MAAAVRTLLECIGEDPDREGLLKTPERYAKALLWMTKGYADRLPGESRPLRLLETAVLTPGTMQTLLEMPSSQRTTTRWLLCAISTSSVCASTTWYPSRAR
jgi:hypothetical protein